MISITDLVPVAEKVSIRGHAVEVNGLSFEHMARLIAGFPAVAGFFTDGVNAAAFLAASPDLAAMVIGAGIGQDDPASVEAIKKLPAGDAVKLLNAVLKGTMPDGPGPFLQMLETVEGFTGGLTASRTKAPATSSGKQRPASSGAAATDTPKS